MNTVIHCKTQEQWDEVLEKEGIMFNYGKFNKFKEISCIDISSGSYSYVGFYRNKPDFYKIISFAEWESKNPTTNIDFKNRKIWIGNDPELSKKVQERLFELSFLWCGDKRFEPRYINSHILFTTNKHIEYTSNRDKSYYNEHRKKELLASDLLNSNQIINKQKQKNHERNKISGKAIKVQRLLGNVSRGKRPKGHRISGRTGKAAITSGYSCYERQPIKT